MSISEHFVSRFTLGRNW